ncbi:MULTISPECIES: hypothetical protein [Nocardia]|jgi:hypothetical protein|uniref:Secreted protein n=1 Tax=Nocardia ignorata TaxID=145285 RepID=A0A4R6PKC5_NOCIG|nr:MULTISPECIES: hypothetical protein [Nocardia]MBC7299744.1 hypothetical protein [Nocardia sp.]TDP38607.1 hypothetical protein DFR75_103264 [Nocardia ignorata]
MNATTKFAGFAVGLAAVFGIAVAVGATIGPDPDPSGPAGHGGHAAPSAPGPSTDMPGGLMVTDQGYTLELDKPNTTTAAQTPISFRILDATGAPVTKYQTSHDKDLHLIVVRRDMAGFQHVHPVLDPAGTWSVPLNLSRAGDYRVFADFTPAGGSNLTLGADLRVAGNYDVQALPAPAATARVGEYEITLTGTITPGAASPVTLSVSRNGAPVTDLQPYLGAYGHLVALRAADLAYLHVHPEGAPGDGVTPAGPGVDFVVNAPSTGDYRLFLDFQHQGVVRTAEFTLSVTTSNEAAAAPTAPTAPTAPANHGAPGHGH